MRHGNSIANIPLLIGIGLSVAAHAAALYSWGGFNTPAQPLLESGRTVVHLTLIPSIAQPETTTEPESVPPTREQAEPVPAIIEETPEPSLPPEPAEPGEPIAESIPETVAPTPSPYPVPASVEQDATVIENKGVTTEAVPLQSIIPQYPRISQRRGEQGTVMLSIAVRANGKPSNVTVAQSSGFRRLDEAAVMAAWETEYRPEQRNGKRVDSTIIQPVVFNLTQAP